MRTDDAGVIRVGLRKQLVVQRFLHDAVGRVFHALAALVAHHVLLVRQRRLVEHVQQVAHAVGMGPQGQFQLVRRHRVEIIGAVEIRAAVRIGGARAFQQLVGHAARHVLGGGKHHVLEQVRKARQARRFIRRTHVIPDVDGRDGQFMVFHEDHVEAIWQRVFFVRNIRHGRRGGRSGGVGQAQGGAVQRQQQGGYGQQFDRFHACFQARVGEDAALGSWLAQRDSATLGATVYTAGPRRPAPAARRRRRRWRPRPANAIRAA